MISMMDAPLSLSNVQQVLASYRRVTDLVARSRQAKVPISVANAFLVSLSLFTSFSPFSHFRNFGHQMALQIQSNLTER
jgi:hypothetical protein